MIGSFSKSNFNYYGAMLPSLTIYQTPFNASRGSRRIFWPNVFLSATLIGKNSDWEYFFLGAFEFIYVWAALLLDLLGAE